MLKEEALKLFYENNNIDPDKLYEKDRIFDLPQKLDKWLQGVAPEDRPVFLEVFSRYTYLTQKECQDRFVILLELLKKELQLHGIGLNEVLYVTVESSEGIKLGGDNIRADMQIYNFDLIDNSQILAAQSKFSAEQLKGVKAVIFVDDILGTGKTVWSNFNNFCRRYGLDGHGIPKLFYMCLSPTERAIKHLNENFSKYNYSVIPIYKKEWISAKAFFADSEEYRIFDKYERAVDSFFEEAGRSCYMGFEKSCLLISFYYNTPNNTVSCFWRPTDFNHPPFKRNGRECKRPCVTELSRKKKQSDENAYYFAAGIDKK